MPRRWVKIVAAVYTVALIVVSVLPPAAEGESGWDTVVSPDVQNALHVPAYAVLGILAAAACNADRSKPLRFAAVALGCVALGVVMLLGRRRCVVCSLVTRGLGCPPPGDDATTESR